MKKTKQFYLGVWGTPNHSPWEICQALERLRISYTANSKGAGRKKQVKFPDCETSVDSVVVTDHTGYTQMTGTTFVAASYAELSETNFPRFLEGDIHKTIPKMLRTQSQVIPEVRKMGAMDYVNLISKPSVLNEIQARIYKIQPYALRKEANSVVLGYFNSVVSERAAREFLQRSLKTEPLAKMLTNARNIREAVKMLSKMSADEVSEKTGVATFDLLYLSKVRK